ncbi:PREDICTED: probable ethanolamine kinase isoform X4 [Nelumbo nucifera]|uniref:ethanolamine kinase n=1 Tax=Nelumbo nucifera TaxID=4432 RepID=A0A1U8Q1A4_NELNU|nr:PREDICTED: probable ethanolamine kinase isoform X4 [Nelumbo nucifera]
MENIFILAFSRELLTIFVWFAFDRGLCKDLFKKWSHLDESRFSVETVSGGITNLLLKISVREDNGSDVPLTVRLYGPNTEYVIDRERELQAIGYLSAAGFGAKLHGVFGNGMVQSFINARTLSPSDMRKPKLAAEIARQLRKFHEVEIPGSKEPQLWNDIFKFFEKASVLKFDEIEKQRQYDTISFKEVHDAIVELKGLTDVLDAPVVFAHNDLLSGNLMLNDDEAIEAMILGTTSMNMQALIVTTTCIQIRMNSIISFGIIYNPKTLRRNLPCSVDISLVRSIYN